MKDMSINQKKWAEGISKRNLVRLYFSFRQLHITYVPRETKIEPYRRLHSFFPLNMEDNSRNAVAMARFLAIFHIVVGSLLIIFGIADSVTTINDSNEYFWTGYGFFGVWIGTWVSDRMQT